MKSLLWLPILLMVLSVGVLIFANVNAYRQRKIQKAADAKLERYRKGLIGEDEMIYSDENGANTDQYGQDQETDNEDFYIDDRYFDDDFNMNNEQSDAQGEGYDNYNDYNRNNDSQTSSDGNRSESVRKMKKRIDDNPFV